jgi:hypothetical protein
MNAKVPYTNMALNAAAIFVVVFVIAWEVNHGRFLRTLLEALGATIIGVISYQQGWADRGRN